jgi:hypothetical protein
MPGKQRRDPKRRPMVRCTRAIVNGVRGWHVTWLDYEKEGWRQTRFFKSEEEARALARELKRR